VRGLAAAAALTAVVTGCVSVPPHTIGDVVLERAERLLARGEYPAALATYDEFLGRHPDHVQARTARDTVAEVLATRAELARLREELTARDQELSRARDELAKIRQELQTRQAEAERLRSDLERLKQIDLKPERKRP
jgi:chromosome segregation ATPase